jgi:hypothetical protein
MITENGNDMCYKDAGYHLKDYMVSKPSSKSTFSSLWESDMTWSYKSNHSITLEISRTINGETYVKFSFCIFLEVKYIQGEIFKTCVKIQQSQADDCITHNQCLLGF